MQTVTLYRNVQPFIKGPDRPRDPAGEISLGTPANPTVVKARYLTKGGRYVLIKGQTKGRAPFGDDQWGYIDSRYLPPKYTSAPGTASDPLCILDPGRTKVPNANNHSNWPKVCTNGSGNKPSADK